MNNLSIWVTGTQQQKQDTALRIANFKQSKKFQSHSELIDTVKKVCKNMYNREPVYLLTDVMNELGISRNYFMRLVDVGICDIIKGQMYKIRESELKKLKHYLQAEEKEYMIISDIVSRYKIPKHILLKAVNTDTVRHRRYLNTYKIHKEDLLQMFHLMKKGA